MITVRIQNPVTGTYYKLKKKKVGKNWKGTIVGKWKFFKGKGNK